MNEAGFSIHTPTTGRCQLKAPEGSLPCFHRGSHQA